MDQAEETIERSGGLRAPQPPSQPNLRPGAGPRISSADSNIPAPKFSSAAVNPTTPGREVIIVLTLAAVQFITIVDFMVIMPLGQQLMESLSLEMSEFGFVVSSYTLAGGIAGLIASALIDRLDRKVAFLTVDAGFLIGTALCGFANTYATLLLARLVTGAFGGILGGMAMSIIGDIFPEERRGRATGALMTGFGLASAGGVPLGLFLGTKYGWQFPFIVLAVLGAPILLIAAITLPRMRGHLRTAPTNLHPFRVMFESFAHPNHLRAFALVVSLMFAGFVVFPFISQYLVRNIGVTQEQLPWIFVAGGAATLFVVPMVGWFADRYGKLRMFRIIAPASAVITLVITCYSSATVMTALALVALVMVTNSARMVPAMAMITSSVEPHRRGGFLSANSCVQHLALGIAASIGGMIVVAPEGGPVQNYPIVGGLSAASTIISLWLAGRIRAIAPEQELTPTKALAAGAEGMYDAEEPLM